MGVENIPLQKGGNATHSDDIRGSHLHHWVTPECGGSDFARQVFRYELITCGGCSALAEISDIDHSLFPEWETMCAALKHAGQDELLETLEEIVTLRKDANNEFDRDRWGRDFIGKMLDIISRSGC